MTDSLTTAPELAAILDSLELARDSGAALYVELGVRRAGTSVRIKEVLSRSGARAHLLGIDCDPKAEKKWNERMGVSKLLARVTWSFECAKTSEAAKIPRAGPCAWVFVDACHCFECATADIETWGQKVAAGGILVVHDTTAKRRHYQKLFQHGGTRRFGSFEAAEKSEASGILSAGWRKLWDIDDVNGCRVYQKE